MRKHKQNISLALFFSALTSCNKEPKLPKTFVACAYDITDSIVSVPNASNILRLYNFAAHKNEAATFYLLPITDHKINTAYAYHLGTTDETEMNNVQHQPNYRDACINRLCRSVNYSITTTNSEFEKSGPANQSECYYTICRLLQQVAESKCENRYLLIYSNLFENNRTFSVFNSGDKAKLFKDPNCIWGKLVKIAPLPESLHGIKIFIVYTSNNQGDEATFLQMFAMYKSNLERLGAKVEYVSSDNEIFSFYEKQN